MVIIKCFDAKKYIGNFSTKKIKMDDACHKRQKQPAILICSYLAMCFHVALTWSPGSAKLQTVIQFINFPGWLRYLAQNQVLFLVLYIHCSACFPRPYLIFIIFRESKRRQYGKVCRGRNPGFWCNVYHFLKSRPWTRWSPIESYFPVCSMRDKERWSM